MKNLKSKIEKLGLNYKKEMIILGVGAVILFAIFLVLALLLKNYVLILVGVIFAGVYGFMFIYRYYLKEEAISRKLVNDFITYFSFFRIYIFNGENVYSALEKTIEFTNEKMKPLVEGLLAEINEDKTITPFMNFAKNFKSKLIEEIMISIYEMVDNGNNPSYINQFTSIFESFKKRNNSENELKRIEKFDRYINSSLIGSGLIMIILLYGIINLIGEII